MFLVFICSFIERFIEISLGFVLLINHLWNNQHLTNFDIVDIGNVVY